MIAKKLIWSCVAIFVPAPAELRLSSRPTRMATAISTFRS